MKADGQRNIQPVGEHHRFSFRVDAVGLVMGDDFFAPREGVPRVVPDAVKEFAKIKVEVFKEGVDADNVGKSYAQVSAIFLGPRLESLLLERSKVGAESLKCLEVFMGHGSNGNEAEVFGQQHVAGAREFFRVLGREGPHDLALPSARKSSAGSKIGKFKAFMA